MLTNISWSNYIIAVTVLIISWYLFLGFKFYKTEFKHVLSGKQKIKLPAVNYNKKNPALQEIEKEDIPQSALSNSFEESFSTLEDAEELSARLITAASEYPAAGMSKEEFTNYIKLILNEYPYVKNSSLRTMVNNVLLVECDKHPEIILNYTEADALWNDNI